MPRATSANRLSQKSRRLCGSTALVGSSSSSSSGLVQRGGGEREPLPLTAAQRAGALLARCARDRTPAERRRCAAARSCFDSPKMRAMNVQVLGDREVLPQRELLRHVAEPRAHALGVARHLVAQDLDAARRRHAAGRTACGSSSTCPSRSARGSRRSGTRDVEVDVVDRDDTAEPARQAATRRSPARARCRGESMTTVVMGLARRARTPARARRPAARRRADRRGRSRRGSSSATAILLRQRVVRRERRLGRHVTHACRCSDPATPSTVTLTSAPA